MTNHPPQEQISALLDRQLDPKAAAEVELHLRQCENCRLFHEELALTSGLFGDLETLQTPAHLWTRVATELQQPTRRWRFPRLNWQGEGWVFQPQFLIVAAAILLMVGGTLMVLHHRSVLSEVAVLAQIENVHASLAARDADVYNPFHASTRIYFDSNPFTRQQLSADSNPFESLRKRH